DELLAIAIRMPPTALMRMLLRRTPWYSRVAVSPRRQQIEANIEKLLDLARQFEQRGFRNLLDFVEELDRLRTVADTEAEAAVISDDNVITLMTIHAAKGLEFPVVYLVGTDQQSGGRSSQLLAADPIGLAIKTTRNGEATVTGAIAHDILQQREQAEERRLLYVALTRAKDHLFIAGTLHTSSNAKASIQPRGYLGTIGAALGIEWDALLGMRSISIPAWVRTDAGNPEVKQLTVTVEIIHQMPAQTAPQVLHRRTAGSILTEPIIGAIEGEIFSASQLALFARSPEEFYRVYRCGLPARSDDMRRSLPLLEQPEQIVGTFVGRIVHRMLEILLPAQRWEETDILTTLERVLHEHQCIEMHALKNRVVSDVRSTLNFLRTHNLLTRVSSISLERPMIIPLGRHFLLGVPDVVLATGRGWEVWDWKTDRRDGIAMDELIGRYRRQLEVYALLVSYLHPKQTSYTVRLIATRPPVEMATLTLGQEDIQRVKCEIEETINQIEQLTLAT
ncbi:MAG: PD-(D/E)XK nuclease family protein, partial [Chlorobi bacterium]|nr:PD-(D/E)XK nuclease family protein [Chlorobiota bacterium]